MPGKVTFPNKSTKQPRPTDDPNESLGSNSSFVSRTALTSTWTFSFGLWNAGLCVGQTCKSLSMAVGFNFLQVTYPVFASSGRYLTQLCKGASNPD